MSSRRIYDVPEIYMHASKWHYDGLWQKKTSRRSYTMYRQKLYIEEREVGAAVHQRRAVAKYKKKKCIYMLYLPILLSKHAYIDPNPLSEQHIER